MSQILASTWKIATNKTYQERMTKQRHQIRTIIKYLGENVKLLDFGSGFSPEFIKQVAQTGTHYVATMFSKIVQSRLQRK